MGTNAEIEALLGEHQWWLHVGRTLNLGDLIGFTEGIRAEYRHGAGSFVLPRSIADTIMGLLDTAEALIEAAKEGRI